MDYSKYLNENQLEAVTTSMTHVRVVAGAGSGKTRVLTYRIAYLLSDMNVKASHILAITFTNKAAKEMKERINKLVPEYSHDLQIKTFHSFAAFFLRLEIDAIGFSNKFTIMDEEDQDNLIKNIASELGYKKKDPIVKKAMNYIASNKLHERYPDDIVIKNEMFEGESECLKIYELYEEAKDRMYTLDFDDLLLKANYILSEFPAIRDKWQKKYDHILVDEFQDTNDVEYKFIKFLMKPSTSLYVVGDPDQTIYTWRGANQDIILDMTKKYEDLETIILNENYRSTQRILDSANKLIIKNKFRVHKDLYTKKGEGDPIVVKACASTMAEAEYIAREIKNLTTFGGYSYKDIAILYRSNYVTQDIEKALMAKRINYQIFGGMKFYQRKEVKDLLAYFTLLINNKDDISFERIANVPTRKVGDASLLALRKEAHEANLSEYEYVQQMDIDETEVSKSAFMALKSLVVTLEETRAQIELNDEAFIKPLEQLIDHIGYYPYLLKMDDGDERVENARALLEDIRHYLSMNPEASFESYLENVTLLSAQDEIIDGEYISLMTVHTAKGLEFPVVFIARCNQEVFPNGRALMEGSNKALEEERRLFYVAITRAKKKLYLTLAGGYSYVGGGDYTPSQFIKESGNAVPVQEGYNPNRSQTRTKEFFFDDEPFKIYDDRRRESPKEIVVDNTPKTNGITDWKVGDAVVHKKFGKGKVVSLQGDDIIVVEFETEGRKTLMGNHPSLSRGD